MQFLRGKKRVMCMECAESFHDGFPPATKLIKCGHRYCYMCIRFHKMNTDMPCIRCHPDGQQGYINALMKFNKERMAFEHDSRLGFMASFKRQEHTRDRFEAKDDVAPPQQATSKPYSYTSGPEPARPGASSSSSSTATRSSSSTATRSSTTTVTSSGSITATRSSTTTATRSSTTTATRSSTTTVTSSSSSTATSSSTTTAGPRKGFSSHALLALASASTASGKAAAPLASISSSTLPMPAKASTSSSVAAPASSKAPRSISMAVSSKISTCVAGQASCKASTATSETVRVAPKPSKAPSCTRMASRPSTAPSGSGRVASKPSTSTSARKDVPPESSMPSSSSAGAAPASAPPASSSNPGAADVSRKRTLITYATDVGGSAPDCFTPRVVEASWSSPVRPARVEVKKAKHRPAPKTHAEAVKAAVAALTVPKQRRKPVSEMTREEKFKLCDEFVHSNRINGVKVKSPPRWMDDIIVKRVFRKYVDEDGKEQRTFLSPPPAPAPEKPKGFPEPIHPWKRSWRQGVVLSPSA